MPISASVQLRRKGDSYVRPKDIQRAGQLDRKLMEFSSKKRALVGINSPRTREAFVAQLIDSLRRVEYARAIRADNNISPLRADPANDIFDPLRAAVLKKRDGELDEAFWLVFLSVHFGKHSEDGWRLTRDVYGGLGSDPWSWLRVSAAPDDFRAWLGRNQVELKSGNVSRRFSNHRKYESLNASKNTGTGAAVASYIAWVGPTRGHAGLIKEAEEEVGSEKRAMFDYLYHSMKIVKRFGRLAKFDYLTMLGKLELAPIEPGSAYLSGATGPLRGARLLFAGAINAKLDAATLDGYLNELDDDLTVGMQVLEDSICNWQKSPEKYVSFRG